MAIKYVIKDEVQDQIVRVSLKKGFRGIDLVVEDNSGNQQTVAILADGILIRPPLGFIAAGKLGLQVNTGNSTIKSPPDTN